jgi:hypothetical protein
MSEKVYNYHCFNSEHRKRDIVHGCEYCGHSGELQIAGEDSPEECPFEGSDRTLKRMGEKLFGGPVTKLTSQQIKQDRLKRSREHFKKEVFPTLDPNSMEGKHFAKKLKK